MTSHVYITINLFNLCQQSFLPFYIYFLKCWLGWMNLFENPWEHTKETREVSKSRASGPSVTTRPFSLSIVSRKLPSSHDTCRYRLRELFRRCLFHIIYNLKKIYTPTFTVNNFWTHIDPFSYMIYKTVSEVNIQALSFAWAFSVDNSILCTEEV